MGRKRAALQRQNGLRVRGDAFSAASHLASSLADPRAESSDTAVAVLPKCAQLFSMLSSDVILAHYIAQGFPALIHRLLPYGVAACLDVDGHDTDASPQLPALLLCALLIRCGAPMSDVGAAVEKQIDALVAIAADANAAVAGVALVILRSAVSECEHAVTVATRLLQPESALWACASTVAGRLSPDAHQDTTAPQVSLAGLVHLVRLCVGTAGSAVDNTVGEHVVAWARSLPLEACELSLSDKRQALEDATILLFATLRIEVPELAPSVAAAVTAWGLDEQLEDADVSTAPVTSHAIAVTLYAHASDPAAPLHEAHRCVQELRERDFDATKRLASVERLASLLLVDMAESYGGVYACAVLYYLPGAVSALYGAVCDVEVSTGACACHVLATALKPAPEGATTPQQWGLGFVPRAFFQNEVAELVVRLGCVLTLEDALGDYNADVVTAALALTASLLCHAPQARGAVLSSLCLQRVVELCHAVAERDDVQAYMADTAHRCELSAAFDVLCMLTTAELAALPEDIVADVSTVTTFCRDDLAVLAQGLAVVARLAEAHPYAATLVVDYDFVTEQLQAPDEPQGAEQCLVIGTLAIMTAMAAQVPSTVSLEWIELLLLCLNRLQVWQASSEMKLAMWRCLHETLVVSEDSREYIFEEEALASWLVSVLREETDARVLTQVLRTALYVPVTLHGLVDAVLDGVVLDRCAKETLAVVAPETEASAAQHALLDAIALLTCRAEEARASPRLFACLGAIVTCAMAWPTFVPELLGPLQDCFIATWEAIVPRVEQYVRETFHVHGAGVSAPQQNAVTADDAVPSPDEAEDDGTAAVLPDAQVAVVLLEALGAAATASMSACTSRSRRACAVLASDIIRTAEPVPVKASLAALFLLLQALMTPDSADVATALLDGSFFDAVRQFAARSADIDADGEPSTDDRHGESAELDGQICEALYQTTGRLVQSLPYERQQKLEDETALVSFLSHCALHDVSKSYACGDLLMHVLASAGVRKYLCETAPDAYRDALIAMEAQRGTGPLQFVFESYKSELS